MLADQTLPKTLTVAAVQRDTQQGPDVSAEPDPITQPQESPQEESTGKTGQLREAQRSDPDIGAVVKFLENSDERPPSQVVEPLSSDVKIL